MPCGWEGNRRFHVALAMRHRHKWFIHIRAQPLVYKTPSAISHKVSFHFGRPFVKRFALFYQTVLCLSCLSVTLVYCGQTVGWIKMKLGMQIGLDPGHIVLDGDPAPLP